jgi:hypothetical protein
MPVDSQAQTANPPPKKAPLFRRRIAVYLSGGPCAARAGKLKNERKDCDEILHRDKLH